MASLNKSRKKSQFPKRSKKSWRVTDIKDVEQFYEEKLFEERLGGPLSEKPDEELFFIHKEPSSIYSKEIDGDNKTTPAVVRVISDKKRRALAPPKCFMSLENSSKVQDPLAKRNRTKTKVERKSKIQKDIEEKYATKGIIKQSEIMAKENRRLNKRNLRKKPKPYTFDKDPWKDNAGEKDVDEKYLEWMEDDMVRHLKTNTGKLKVKAPKSITVKPTTLPNLEKPHPGISYNPAPEDHHKLLQIVADTEIKMINEEERIRRTTTAKFSKLSPEEVLKNWITEMSQGLPQLINKSGDVNQEVDEEEDSGEYKPINPPAPLKKKPLKKIKKARLLKKEEVERKKKLMEKKKLSEIYRLKSMKREIKRKEAERAKRQEKKKVMIVENLKKTKKLGPLKFEEPLLEFQRPHELRKNLRKMKPEGSILKDRFYSLQKRNILEPLKVNHRNRKPKQKRVFKKGCRVDDSEIEKIMNEMNSNRT